MTEFERQLSNALARREPPAGFTERVIAAASQPHAARSWWNRIVPPASVWRLVPATAALLIAGSGALYRYHERAEQGEAAKRQLVAAIRIAGEKLHTAQQRVVEIGEIRTTEGSY